MYSQPLGNHQLQIIWQSLDLTLGHSFKVTLWRVNIKVPISHLLLVLVVSNVQSTFKGKPQASNLFLVISPLTTSFRSSYGSSTLKCTYDPNHSFKHKIVATNIKLSLSSVLMVLLVGSVQLVCWKSKAADLLLLIPALPPFQPLCVVDTFMHLPTDANILQFIQQTWPLAEFHFPFPFICYPKGCWNILNVVFVFVQQCICYVFSIGIFVLQQKG